MKNFLNDLPVGNVVYVDSNIFIYDTTEHPKYSLPCSNFLDRVESGGITGITSILTVNETIHKLSIIELSSKMKERPVSIIRMVKKDPSLLDALDIPYIAAEDIMDMNLEIVSFSNLIFEKALRFMKQHRLMSNDAVHLATMQRYGITNIATNDGDFERVGGLKVWKP